VDVLKFFYFLITVQGQNPEVVSTVSKHLHDDNLSFFFQLKGNSHSSTLFIFNILLQTRYQSIFSPTCPYTSHMTPNGNSHSSTLFIFDSLLQFQRYRSIFPPHIHVLAT